MGENNKGSRSVRLAGILGGLLVAGGLYFLRSEQRIRADGIVYARNEARIYAPADATLAALHVNLGQNVVAGEPLFDLDSPDLRLRAIQGQRDLAQMRAALAQNDVALRATNVLPSLEQEKLQVEDRRLREGIGLAENELHVTTNLLASLHIVSPMDGRVVELDCRYPGIAAPRGTPLAKIAAIDGQFRVRALVGEKNIDLVRPGTRVYMKSGVFDAVLEGYVKGHVVRIGPEGAAAADAAGRGPRYEVFVDVDQTPYPLSLGSGMQVELLLGRRSIWGMLFQTHQRRVAESGVP